MFLCNFINDHDISKKTCCMNNKLINTNNKKKHKRKIIMFIYNIYKLSPRLRSRVIKVI